MSRKGPARAVEQRAHRLRRWSRLAAAQILEPGPRQAGLLGRDLEACGPGRPAARRPGDGPVVVSSSRPSEPCTTQARSAPSRPSTWASGSTQSRGEHADQLAPAPAGFESGPEQVEDRARAELDPGAGDVAHRAVMARRHHEADAGLADRPLDRAGSASMLTPSAVSTSAEPAFDDSARLPCLATGTPQAATTSAAAVETLKVPDASPPVPQVSIASAGAADLDHALAQRLARRR